MVFGHQHVSNKNKTMSGGVTDIGTGLQAVAAAITDPDTISAFQSEDKDGRMSHRTFYGGMHELSGGLDDAASGIHEFAKALHHVGDAFETIAKSFHTLAASVVDLQGAIQRVFKKMGKDSISKTGC